MKNFNVEAWQMSYVCVTQITVQVSVQKEEDPEYR